ISLNAVYTYYVTYGQVWRAYNQSTTTPVFLLETHYEFESNPDNPGTPRLLRRQEYWSVLAGAIAGYMYGNSNIWPFPTGWQAYLDTPGVVQLQVMKDFFMSYRWYDLVPDQNHTVVTAGYGTFTESGTIMANDYVTAARIPDGSVVLAYLPTVRTITVD